MLCQLWKKIFTPAYFQALILLFFAMMWNKKGLLGFCIGLLMLSGCQGQVPVGDTTITYRNGSDSIPSRPISALRDSINKVITRFEKQIVQFEKSDSAAMPELGGNLFIGSSSFRIWKSMENDLSNWRPIRRGFGGSTLPEVLYYADRILFRYKPKRIILYCGENDMTLAYSVPGDVLYSVRELAERIQDSLPESKLYFVSIKPCPYSWNYWPKIQEANQLVKTYIEQQPSDRMAYIDITGSLLKEDGSIDSTLFLKDGIHMNSSGYVKWTKIINEFLEKNP